ncbi:MAG: hypothetical protein ACLRMZ_20625 [Blautia marasmi]
MPASGGHTDAEIVEAVRSGELKEEVLDTAVERILNIIFKFTDNRQPGNFDREEIINWQERLPGNPWCC